MTICDLTQFYSPFSGGVRRYVAEKASHLGAAGHRHVLIVPGKKTERQVNGLQTLYTIESPLVSRTARYRALLNLNLVEEALEREKPDLIESGDPYQVAWKALASGRALGIPTVGFYHSHFPDAVLRSVAKYFGSISVMMAEEIGRRYVTNLYNRFERTLVPSEGLSELLRSWGLENVETLELGVDTGLFFPDSVRGRVARLRLGWPTDRQILLYVGRLNPDKNVKRLLETFALLHQSDRGRFHLVVVGDGMLRGALLRLQEETESVNWVQFCAGSAELADIYRAADLFVHPGVKETFGLVTLESQACGTPVVGIRGSYMDAINFSGLHNWSADNSAEALAEAIRSVANADLSASGLHAAASVRSRYAWKDVFERLFTIYRGVIASYNP
ncbi:MAG: glycosyltransferase [Verrucomicrobiota bacterium]